MTQINMLDDIHAYIQYTFVIDCIYACIDICMSPIC